MLVTSIVVTKSCNQFLTAKLFKQGYRSHKLCKAFSNEKYHVSLKKLLQQGISNPEFYGNLIYRFKKILGNPIFTDLFKHIVNRCKKKKQGIIYILCDRLYAYFLTQTWLKGMHHSIVARRWFRPQTQ